MFHKRYTHNYSKLPFIFYKVGYKFSSYFVLYIAKLCQTPSFDKLKLRQFSHELNETFW